VVTGLQQRRCGYRMETVMRSAVRPGLVAAGVEEEFHIVDLATRRLTGQADRLMARLPAGRFSWEMQRSVVEANSRPWACLTELAEDIAGLRQEAIAAADLLGLGIVAAGTVPLADPGTLQVTADPRYERIRGEYRMLVREQLICSTQVHVDVDDRDLAIAVGRRVAPWLPALLALSASSPFWLGTDTGYASYRTLIWRRWPTAGALPGFESAAEYDGTVADLVRSGVIADAGMIYFDVRPSAHLPTLELRICDSCPALEDVVLLAGLFCALVIREIEAEHEGLPPVSVRPGLLEAATWRAAQAGLQGDLVDPVTADPVPASRLIGQLLTGLRPALESAGDWELVSELARSALARGSSAARQRAAHGSGGLRAVVDTLIAETRAVPPWLNGARRVA
jgi:glutamate---cysteine ligase / carboxylate-amine ligase